MDENIRLPFLTKLNPIRRRFSAPGEQVAREPALIPVEARMNDGNVMNDGNASSHFYSFLKRAVTIEDSIKWDSYKKTIRASILSFILVCSFCAAAFLYAPALMLKANDIWLEVATSSYGYINAPLSTPLNKISVEIFSGNLMMALDKFISNGFVFAFIAVSARILLFSVENVLHRINPREFHRWISGLLSFIVTAVVLIACFFWFLFFINSNVINRHMFALMINLLASVCTVYVFRYLYGISSAFFERHIDEPFLTTYSTLLRLVDILIFYAMISITNYFNSTGEVSLLTAITWNLPFMSLISTAATGTVFMIAGLKSMASLILLLCIPGVPLRPGTVAQLYKMSQNALFIIDTEYFFVHMTAEQSKRALKIVGFKDALEEEGKSGDIPTIEDSHENVKRQLVFKAVKSYAGSGLVYKPNASGLPGGRFPFQNIHEIRERLSELSKDDDFDCDIIGIKFVRILLFITGFYFPGIFSVIPGITIYNKVGIDTVGKQLSTHHSIFMGDWTQGKWNPWGMFFNFGWWPAFFAFAFNYHYIGFIYAIIGINSWWVIAIYLECIYPILIIIFYSTVLTNPRRANGNGVYVAADLSLSGGGVGGKRCLQPESCGSYHGNIWCKCKEKEDRLNKNVHMGEKKWGRGKGARTWWCYHRKENYIPKRKFHALKKEKVVTLGTIPTVSISEDKFYTL